MTTEEETFICFHCEEKYPLDEATSCDGELYCPSCAEDYLFCCNDCGEIALSDDSETTIRGDTICHECRNNHYTRCDDCGELVEDDDIIYHEDNGEYYCPDCYNNHDIDSDEPCERSVGKEVKGKTFKHNRHKRRFGVEIEAENGNSYDLDDELDNLNSTWGLTYDGSLDNSGIEAVSPILSGDEGYKSIEETCEAMSEAGFKPSVRAGVHIHFDFTRATEDDIKKIVAGYYLYERFFLRMLPSSRHNGNYCKLLPIAYDNLPQKIWGKLDDIYYCKSDKTSKYCGLRYATLNIHSWFYRGTLEVRSHSATLNPTKIINWIEIHQRFFDYCLSKPLNYWLFTKPTIKEWNKILGQRLVKYYNERVRELQGTKRIDNKKLKGIIKMTKKLKSELSNTDFELTRLLRNERMW